MTGLIMFAQLMLGLSLLVFIHELGHFLAAKLFGMRVPKFYIFFDAWGKKIWSKKIGDTEYGIGWLPLGGYVQIAGMIDETQDAEQLSEEPEPWEFRSKPAWQRFIVMIAGIVMNVILGIAIFTMHLQTFQKEYLPLSEINKDGIYAHAAAQEIGLQTGDKIIAINGETPERFKDTRSAKVYLGESITVERNNQKEEIAIPEGFFKRMREPFVEPMFSKVSVAALGEGSNAEKAGIQVNDQIIGINETKIDRFVDLKNVLDRHKKDTVKVKVVRGGQEVIVPTVVDTLGRLGFAPEITFPYEFAKYDWGTSLAYGYKDGYDLIVSQAIAMGMMVSGKMSVADNLASPIAIAHIYGGTWQWDRFWYITGLLSFILAFMNILPIPALDGGHMMFIIIETIIGRKLSDDFMEKAQMFGVIILLCIMVFAFGNDIYKTFMDKF